MSRCVSTRPCGQPVNGARITVDGIAHQGAHARGQGQVLGRALHPTPVRAAGSVGAAGVAGPQLGAVAPRQSAICHPLGGGADAAPALAEHAHADARATAFQVDVRREERAVSLRESERSRREERAASLGGASGLAGGANGLAGESEDQAERPMSKALFSVRDPALPALYAAPAALKAPFAAAAAQNTVPDLYRTSAEDLPAAREAPLPRKARPTLRPAPAGRLRPVGDRTLTHRRKAGH